MDVTETGTDIYYFDFRNTCENWHTTTTDRFY